MGYELHARPAYGGFEEDKLPIPGNANNMFAVLNKKDTAILVPSLHQVAPS